MGGERLSQTLSAILATREARIIPVFAIKRSSGWCAKPNSAIKIDMVKPMPAMSPAPKICLKLRMRSKCDRLTKIYPVQQILC